MNRFRLSSLAIVALLLGEAIAIAQTPTLLAVQPRQGGARRDNAAAAATVALASEGGFRWARTERITVSEANGRASITIERVPYDGKTQGPTTVAITKAQHDALVAALTEAGAATLKDDQSRRGKVRDAPDYEISVVLAGKPNRFRVFAPQVMDNGYTRIVDAIEALAEKALPSPPM